MAKINDYTKAEVSGISGTGKGVLRKHNPRYSPRNGKEPMFLEEELSISDIEKLRLDIGAEVDKLSRMEEKPPELYFLQHNQAHLERIREDAYRAKEDHHSYKVRRDVHPLLKRKRLKAEYFLIMLDLEEKLFDKYAADLGKNPNLARFVCRNLKRGRN